MNVSDGFLFAIGRALGEVVTGVAFLLAAGLVFFLAAMLKAALERKRRP